MSPGDPTGSPDVLFICSLMDGMGNDTIVFLENQYLHLIGKKFGVEKKYDLNQLAITLAKQEGLWCKGVYLYTAPPFQSENPTDDEKRRKAGHDKFVSYMRRIPNFVVREGRCQKIDGEYHEKGVDALLTADIVTLPYTHKNVKTIIILTCDTDFVPILNKMREEHGIRVILYYYTDRQRESKFSMSNVLHTACDKKVLLTKEHFEMSPYKHKSYPHSPPNPTSSERIKVKKDE